jgi:hypothetical protein
LETTSSTTPRFSDANKLSKANMNLSQKSLPQLEPFVIDDRFERMAVDLFRIASGLNQLKVQHKSFCNCHREQKPIQTTMDFHWEEVVFSLLT